MICTIMLLKKTDEFKLNVFPERMDSDGMRVQLEGSLQLQAIPFVLPYNKYKGGADCFDLVRRNYGFDRKSRCYWVLPFFNYAINKQAQL